MKITHGPFTAEFDGHRFHAKITGQFGAEKFEVMTHTVMYDDDIRSFDRATELSWPYMNAHERSQLRVLMRLILAQGELAKEAYKQGITLDPDVPNWDF